MVNRIKQKRTKQNKIEGGEKSENRRKYGFT